MLTANELRNAVAPSLRGAKRVVRDGKAPQESKKEAGNKRRGRAWYAANREKKLAYQSDYEKKNRAAVNERVKKFRRLHPELSRLQARAKWARVYEKKKAAMRFMALVIAWALSVGG